MPYDSSEKRAFEISPSAFFAICAIAALVIAIAVMFSMGWFSGDLAENDMPIEELKPATSTEAELPTEIKQAWDQIDDPAKDGWDTEVFNENASGVLKKLAKIIATSERLTVDQLQPLLADNFSCSEMFPTTLEVGFDDGRSRVERATPGSGDRPNTDAEGLARSLQSLLAVLGDAKKIKCNFKLFDIERGEGITATRQYVAISGRNSKGMVEQNATWQINWIDSAKDEPLIESIDVVNFEQVTYSNPNGPQFVDCTKSALDQNDCYESQFLRGMNHWFNRVQDTRYFYLLGTPGLATGDVNGDGLEDLYVCQEEGLPNRLFLQQPDGSAVESSAKWEVDWLHNSRGVLLVDLDNDGDQDLAVSTIGHLILAANVGGKFELRKILATDDDAMSLSAADYDNDGDLDIHVSVYFIKEALAGSSRGNTALGAVGRQFGDAAGGGRNTLFRNDIDDPADWSFTDVTDESGLGKDNGWYSFASSWEDYDNDGDMDLYVANDYGRNNLYRNDDGQFIDVADSGNASDLAFGMSVSWSDYDHDNLMDLYVSNMFSSAGNRVTRQLMHETQEVRDTLQRFARGNTLLRNNGDGGFDDVSETAGVTVGRWAWGSLFVDINNDSWDDLVVANGYLTTEDSGDL